MCGIVYIEGELSQLFKSFTVLDLFYSILQEEGVDGYGLLLLDNFGRTYIVQSFNPADISTSLEESNIDKMFLFLAILHARRRTVGEVSIYNIHPVYTIYSRFLTATFTVGTVEEEVLPEKWRRRYRLLREAGYSDTWLVHELFQNRELQVLERLEITAIHVKAGRGIYKPYIVDNLQMLDSDYIGSYYIAGIPSSILDSMRLIIEEILEGKHVITR